MWFIKGGSIKNGFNQTKTKPFHKDNCFKFEDLLTTFLSFDLNIGC